MQTPTSVPPALPALDRLGGATMGTTWSVTLAAPGRDLHALHARVESALDRVVAQMSTWEPDSDLSRFNRAAPGWIALPRELMHVLACALEVARASDGAFDPTLGGLVELWGFGPASRRAFVPPGVAQVAQVREQSGWKLLALDIDGGKALQPGSLQVDLSAIAKGYAVDLVVDGLRDAGIEAALVEVGGELRGYGRKPDGSQWRVLLESDPEREADPVAVVALEDRAIATSGDRWHRHRVDGREYAHTVDPRSGRPLLDPPVSVSVVAGTAMQADAWATALSVAGRAGGLAMAETQRLAARFAWPDGEVAASPAFDRHLAT